MSALTPSPQLRPTANLRKHSATLGAIKVSADPIARYGSYPMPIETGDLRYFRQIVVYAHEQFRPDTHSRDSTADGEIMPFVYQDVDKLKKMPLVDGGDCVKLIKHFIPALANVSAKKSWRPGERVLDARHLARGTAIATFIDGRYPGHDSGNHAAFFLALSGNGFYVMDQWIGKPAVDSRRIEPGRRTRSGRIWTPASDASEFFFVIEL